MVAIFGHVGIDLVLANDDEIHSVLDHDLQDVGPAGQQTRDDVVGALQSQVRHLARGHDRHALCVQVFFVELAGGIPIISRTNSKNDSGWRGHGRPAALEVV